MFFNFSIFFSSLVFLFGLELIVFQNDRLVLLTACVSLFTIYTAHRIGQKFLSGITPLVFTFSSIALLYLVDSALQQQWLIVLSTSVYYLAFLGIYRLRYYERDKTAHGIMAFVTMATSFLFYSSFYGIYLNFAIPIGVFMMAYCLVTMVLSYQYFIVLNAKEIRRAQIYSLLLGLAMAEIAWIVNFWPFGYLTTGVVVLMFYYLLWYMIQSYFLQALSQKHIFVQLALFSLLIGMVLTSTRWVPIA